MYFGEFFFTLSCLYLLATRKVIPLLKNEVIQLKEIRFSKVIYLIVSHALASGNIILIILFLESLFSKVHLFLPSGILQLSGIFLN
jgi:hypothetical protein